MDLSKFFLPVLGQGLYRFELIFNTFEQNFCRFGQIRPFPIQFGQSCPCPNLKEKTGIALARKSEILLKKKKHN